DAVRAGRRRRADRRGGSRGAGGVLPAAVGAERDLPPAHHRPRRARRRPLGARDRRAGADRHRPPEAALITIVTGTDTGVGKTVATAALAVAAGPSTIAVKPAQTGAATGDSDAAAVRRLAGCAVAEFVRLDDPLAPDTAARLRGIDIPPVAEHATRIRDLARTHRTVLV